MREKVSVVLPTYNEIDNIKTVVSNVERVLKKITPKYEIIIVDDNSPDGTGQFIKEYSKNNDKIKVIIREKKTGLGDAYKCGFKYITGDIIFQMDADLSHNPKDIPKFIHALKYGDVVIGSRYIKGGGNLNRNKKRIIISRVANILASFFFRLHQTDCTTGFRAYKRHVIDTIMPHVNCQKYVFLVEMLEKTKKFNFSVSEVAIQFQDRYNGESKFNLREVLEFLKELAKKFFHIEGLLKRR
ncbi:MAG: polyprenol monophosphomannose synthase [Candidatus Helarchaeota archaeon]|nr:polyprenol monophosphomannose synthase [Candidatus Helarchaeota archaeon]